MNKVIISIIIFEFLLSLQIAEAGEKTIQELVNLDSNASGALKSIRNDIKRSIYVIKSRRPARELPELTFYTYKVKKGDTFWTILAKSTLDMDTLLSVNGFSTPRDIAPGKIIYIPNMRGIIIEGHNENAVSKMLRNHMINPEYVYRINKSSDFNKKYLFIPCGKISNLERSLFLGSGFMYPVSFPKGIRKSSGFGMRRSPFDPHHVEFHTGVDVACPSGSQVLAARDGKIVYTGFLGGYGNLVIAEHECGYRSLYGHLSKSLVKQGDEIKKGEVIALSGNTGRTTGPHLHFEVRRGKTSVNPGILLQN
jgi:murein DD-endopeptidase MepM/ murein hydrolase activator NlpD